MLEDNECFYLTSDLHGMNTNDIEHLHDCVTRKSKYIILLQETDHDTNTNHIDRASS